MIAVKEAMEQADINKCICDDFGADWRKERKEDREQEMKASYFNVAYVVSNYVNVTLNFQIPTVA